MTQILKMTQAELDALPEYSRSMPTSNEPGKRWKRRVFRPDGWVVGEFGLLIDGRQSIRWYEPEIIKD